MLFCFLAVLQYRWTGEVSRAEEDRLKSSLQAALNRLSRDFNSEIATACAALLAHGDQIEALGRDAAYAARYRQWKESGTHDPIFRRVGIAIPEADTLELRTLDFNQGKFSQAEWPEAWSGLRDRLLTRIHRGVPGPYAPDDSALIELPRFAWPDRPGPAGLRMGMAEHEWLILELDLDHVRGTLIPQLIQRHLAGAGKLDYEAEVFVRANPSNLIYQSAADHGSRFGDHVDASVTLFDVMRPDVRRLAGPNRPGGPWPGNGPSPPPMVDSGRGRWQLQVRHHAGSLDAIVSRARWRNLAVSVAILLLMIATVAVLLRYSRQAQQLAEQQMNFVAGVSHELRTPLTVIRTAAFNLKGRVANNPAHVERYGKLIQDESEKLTALVEQVLRFASAGAGRIIRERSPVAVENLIDEGLQSSRLAFEGSECVVEKQLEPGLPLVMADGMALKHAIQNLLDNAVKYGTEGSNWIGISAARVSDENGEAVEIRVADRGPGIPQSEQERIFDPFFRGQRAVQDQIHGTGLGLYLVKKIVEAHGGTIRVASEPMKGTEFIVRIPAAPPELQDEFAHSVS